RQAPAAAEGVTAIEERCAGLLAEADAELAAERVVGDDDARLDQHLAYRRVDLPDHAPDLFEPASDVGDEQDVGAWIDECGAALREEPRGIPARRARPGRVDDVEDVRRLRVVQLERFSLQRLQIVDLCLRFELLLFLQRQFLARRDKNDVAVLAHVEALCLHDDVERLVPWHVLEPQRQAPAYRIAGDDVEAGEVGDDLQHRAHFDVLEVERQLLALVSGTGSLDEPVRIVLDRLHLDDEAVVRLVRRMFPDALRLDDHVRVAILFERVDGDDRGVEIGDVHPALEIARDRRLLEINDQLAALLAYVDAGVVVGKLHDDASFAIAAAAEVD